MKNKGESGFILIEAAIFIIILGVSSALIASIYKSLQHTSQIAVTQQNKQIVTRMLANYLLEHSRLPQASNRASSGIEEPGLYFGYVPYKTIGIPRKNAMDGTGKSIKYMVEESFTKTTSLTTDQEKLTMGEGQSFCEINDSGLEIVDQNGSNVSESPICFALMSSDFDFSSNASSKRIVDDGTISWVSKSFLSAMYANFACAND